jgi:hypothetical protein
VLEILKVVPPEVILPSGTELEEFFGAALRPP